VAFTRTAARAGGLAVVVPRLVTGLVQGWAGTTVALPGGAWTDVLTGETVHGGEVSVQTLLRRFPVAVLGQES
jgi:(1->4)-alpha-D-glucan 1-alpha-D-glucosylmutase